MSTNSLFNHIQLEGHRLSNRLVVAPMTRRSATPKGVPTEAMVDYYQAFGRGGFGLIITEGIYTDSVFSQTDLNQPGLVNQEQMEGWKKVVVGVHNSNALIIGQLMHGGSLSQCSAKTIAPSAVQPKGLRSTEKGGMTGPFPIPKEMSEEDLSEVKKGYVQAALLACKAGFDGVELHSANGYLFDQFLTPHTNLRSDRYGGNTYNRLRFLMEVYTAVKEAVPAKFIVGIRLSESKVNDLTYRWPGGSTTAAEIFTVLKELHADYLHVAAEGGNWARECLYEDGSSSSGLAKKITGVPVIANGGLHDIQIAESLVSSQQADLISIGRAALANPDWPSRIAAGKPPIPFFKKLIKPSLTLQHTQAVLKKRKEEFPV
ncbi:NADH:flavin oxidoreductase [Algoriphagus sp. D3-2-R+10]|uniref:oxidoreductase n=1 Tax=Algoriphagus aurantiacus TaxID=3103948 RepID=UPI002B3EA047|nr:NADH:flavin oxidoreductase [Algoriphagus sp. D3-2-R+10]MEB2775398.1 NADH:flavin oxidoreductase [Algoriphagus sp. D3-2-R+10]